MQRDVYADLKAYFEAQGVAYREIRHLPAASAEDYQQALGCRLEQQAKCLFLKVRQQGGSSYALCAIQAQKRGDPKRLAALLGAKEVKLGTTDALFAITGCRFGELPPTASLFGLPLLMDSDFLHEDELFLNAGRLNVSFVIDPRELERIEQPMFF